MKAKIKQGVQLRMSMAETKVLLGVIDCIAGGGDKRVPLHFNVVPEVDVKVAREVLCNIVDVLEEVTNEY